MTIAMRIHTALDWICKRNYKNTATIFWLLCAAKQFINSVLLTNNANYS